MKITIAGYPATISFSVRKKLPKFKYSCPVRNEIARRQLGKQVGSVIGIHHVNNFIVEEIEVKDGFEIWHLGS